MLTNCIDNEKKELLKVRRVLTNEGRCVEKILLKEDVQINCPEPRIKDRVCDNSTDMATIFKLQPVIEACECKPRMQTYKAPCRKCHTGVV